MSEFGWDEFFGDQLKISMAKFWVQWCFRVFWVSNEVFDKGLKISALEIVGTWVYTTIGPAENLLMTDF